MNYRSQLRLAGIKKKIKEEERTSLILKIIEKEKSKSILDKSRCYYFIGGTCEELCASLIRLVQSETSREFALPFTGSKECGRCIISHGVGRRCYF